MTPDEKIRAMLDERGIDYQMHDGGNRVCFYFDYSEQCGDFMKSIDVIGACVIASQSYLTPEQAIVATVGEEPWEPSKEWKAWHESLKHDNPTSIREAVENILYEAIDFGGDMGPNGNVWSGVDEGTVLTENCINGWVKSIEEIAATVGVGTCHCTTSDDAWCFSCSSCGKSFPRDELHMAHNHGEINYCPNCGAKVVAE